MQAASDSSLDAQAVLTWSRTLRRSLRREFSAQRRPRRLLVCVNPFGGRRRAQHIWERVARPLFQLAGVRVQRLLVSQRAGEIRDMLAQRPTAAAGAAASGAESDGRWPTLADVDGVVCVGGDGTVSEVFNGLVERAMWDVREARPVDAAATGRFPQPRLPVGIIPGGHKTTPAQQQAFVLSPLCG